MQKVNALDKKKPQCCNTEVYVSNHSTIGSKMFMKDITSICQTSFKSTTKNAIWGWV